jgi:hypothetical protein
MTILELSACPVGATVEKSGIDFIKQVGGSWITADGSAVVHASIIVGATLRSRASISYQGGACMTGSTWSAQSWTATVPRATRPATPAAPVVPNRPLVAGLRAPTESECAALPIGSIVVSDQEAGTRGLSAWRKHDDTNWLDDDGDLGATGNGFAFDAYYVLRVGPADAPNAYLPPTISADDLIGLLFERPDLRDALAAKVPGMRSLADAIGEIVAHRDLG